MDECVRPPQTYLPLNIIHNIWKTIYKMCNTFSSSRSSITSCFPIITPLFCLIVAHKVQNKICYSSVPVYLSYTQLLWRPLRCCWLLHYTSWRASGLHPPPPRPLWNDSLLHKGKIWFLGLYIGLFFFPTKCFGALGLLLVVVLPVSTCRL